MLEVVFLVTVAALVAGNVVARISVAPLMADGQRRYASIDS